MLMLFEQSVVNKSETQLSIMSMRVLRLWDDLH